MKAEGPNTWIGSTLSPVAAPFTGGCRARLGKRAVPCRGGRVGAPARKAGRRSGFATGGLETRPADGDGDPSAILAARCVCWG